MKSKILGLALCGLVAGCGGATSKDHTALPQASASSTKEADAKPAGSTSSASASSGAPAAEILSPALSQLLGQLTADNPHLPDVAAQIEASGSPVAHQQASQRLIAAAARIGGNEYRDQHRLELKSQAERRGGGVVSEGDLEIALVAFQTERLAPVVAAMDAVGGDPIVEYAFREAEDRSLSVDRRRLSVKLLQHRVAADDAVRTARLAPLVADMDRLAASQGTAHDAANDVQEVTQALTGELRKCADKAMQKTPALDVKGLLELKVGSDGKVTSAEAHEVAPKDLATCVEKAGRGAKFKAPKNGKAFTLRVPVVLKTIPAANP